MEKEFFITRGDDYKSDQVSNISLQDWFIYLRSDKELHLDDVYNCTYSVEETLMEKIVTCCHWSGHPKFGQINPTFRQEDGLIFCLDPDDYTLLKLIEVANLLNCNVVDNEGKKYTEQNLPINELRQAILFNKENFVFEELSVGIELYNSFLKNNTFVADLRGISKNLPSLSASSFKFKLYLENYKEPPRLYSLGRMRKIKPYSPLYEFTVTDMDTGDFLISEVDQY